MIAPGDANESEQGDDNSVEHLSPVLADKILQFGKNIFKFLVSKTVEISKN